MKISLIIAYYRNPIALELILKSLKKQKYQNFEIIIAEDDTKSEFKFLESFRLPQKIKHVFQEKKDGFRKNKILNRAIAASEGDFLVFIDGDCILHKNFISSYVSASSNDYILFGRRVMLGEQTTRELYRQKDLSLLSFRKLLFSDSKKLKYALYLPVITGIRRRGIWGCNWGVHKKHMLAVNAYDEDYRTAGVGEDNDIEWRLQKLGLKLKSIRFSALQFHLHHAVNYSDHDVQIGFRQLKTKMQTGKIYCKNGLKKTK